MIENVVVQRLAWFMGRVLPGVALRRFWSATRLAEAVRIDLRPRNDPVCIDLGPMARFEIWMEIENRSPFTIELDRLRLRLICGPSIEGFVLDRMAIQPGKRLTALCCGGSVDGDVATYIAMHVQANERVRAHVEIRAEFNCSVRNFARSVLLDGVTPMFTNQSYREVSAAKRS